jgi:hypothetical protein
VKLETRAMPLKQGYSSETVARDAIFELREKIWQPDIELVVFFCSPDHDRDAVQQAINIEFPGVNVIGCTTAGEITKDGYQEGSITGLSFSAKYFKVKTVLLESLRNFSMEDGAIHSRAALEGLGLQTPSAKSVPAHAFAMLLVDGMSKQEEPFRCLAVQLAMG